MKGAFRHRLKRRRTDRGLSQRDLANKVGTSQQQIQRVEMGCRVELGLACAIARALDAALVDIFPDELEDVREKSAEPAWSDVPDGWIDLRPPGPTEARAGACSGRLFLTPEELEAEGLRLIKAAVAARRR